MQRVTMNGQELYERRYNTGDDLRGKPHTLTIDKVQVETMHPQGQAVRKAAIYFKQARRPFVLNKQFAESIAQALREYDTAKWAGRDITIYPVPSRGGKGDTILARPAQTQPVQPETQGKENSTAAYAEGKSEETPATLLPMSQVQRRKLIELYCAIHGGSEADAVNGLEEAFFTEVFGHAMSQATYEEAARVTAVLLNEQRNNA
jgi:hypothetical protein